MDERREDEVNGAIVAGKRSFSASFVACLFLWLLPAVAEEVEANRQAPDRPNIVLILADDLGYGDVRCYNPDSQVVTPHMDRLAREGIRFTNAYAPAAVCHPSRYGLLTGRYPFRAEMNWRERSLIAEERMTIGSLLRKHEYITACIGKWHLGFDRGVEYDCSRPLAGGPIGRGFDHYFGIPASLDIPPYFYIRQDRCVAAPTRTIEDSVEPGLTSRVHGRFWRAGKSAPDFRHDDVLDRLTDEAVAFLRKHRRQSPDRPFLLYFSLTAPHTPWVPGERFRGRSPIGAYGDFLTHTDDAIGRVLTTLDELRLAAGEETLVIVTSDNGPLWFEPDIERHGHRAAHVFRGLKGDIWEGGIRVPFIARWPGRIPARSTSDEIVGLVDSLATFAAIVGEELPDDAGEDSVDILPALLGRKQDRPLREALLLQSNRGDRIAIRQGPWKLILWLGSGGFLNPPAFVEPVEDGPLGQLYHLDDDPAERHNLYQKHPDVVERLSKLLEGSEQPGRNRR
ncbi:MAG: arylsulfatase [Planctomycetales bacterium]